MDSQGPGDDPVGEALHTSHSYQETDDVNTCITLATRESQVFA
jgi:hypothetical protein